MRSEISFFGPQFPVSMLLRKAPALVSPAWLAANRGPSVKVVDASWYLPAMGRDARQEFEACRIPGAVFFDVDATDVASPLPHMLPSDAFFARTMSELGIVHDDHVVCYDGKGLFSAARSYTDAALCCSRLISDDLEAPD